MSLGTHQPTPSGADADDVEIVAREAKVVGYFRDNNCLYLYLLPSVVARRDEAGSGQVAGAGSIQPPHWQGEPKKDVTGLQVPAASKS